MKSSIRYIFLTIVMVVTVMLTSACSSGNGSTTGTGEQPTTPASGNGGAVKKVTVNFLHWRGEDQEVFGRLISQFEEANPGIQIETQVFPSDQYQASAQAKLLDGSSGDVFAAFPGAQFEALVRAGLYTDLSGEAFLSAYNPSLIEAGQKDGRQLAVPYQLVYNMPIYNVKLFEEQDIEVPKDWDGFLAAAEKLKQAGIIPIAFPGADIGPGQFMNVMVMNNAPDPDIFVKLEAGETKLTDAWWVKTLAQFKELNDKGYFQPDALGTKDQGAGALFVQDKAAMLATGSYQLAQHKKNNPELEQKLLAPITVPANEMIYEGIHTTTFLLGVNSQSKHPEEAKKWLAFLSSPEAAGAYANATGQNVTVNGVEYETEELKAVAEWSTRKTRFQPRFTMKNAEVQKAVTGSIQAVLAGQTPEQAAADAQAIVNQEIGK
ncbi:sugar ABC transporter substrate-binding protein [Paenibacillus sambharensis]|uniref:Sugar ABC transporter substrate-binding protein n=1 Tax=Paenibacillus sambharensis TaxID=1803190 RepID=A0A2W1LWJ5_9BACL|nr:sugar ABC transporter substrate-binding protein [Paenibacillus sambharensis]PZD95877.1 sugar ABC transporter substrate-binding protein [Paenibacillus sambharensis]